MIAVFDEPAGQLFEVGGSPAAENTSPRSELGTVGDRLKQRLNGGQHQARRFARVELFQEPEPLPSDLIDGMAGGRLVVPGRKEDGTDAGEAKQVAGPGVHVARMGDDDE